MLPDLSPTHILIVVVVALIVVGPKDLPLLLRKIGQFVARMRGMANEFRASFDEMARQSELDDLRKEVEAMRAASQAAIPHNLGIEDALKQSDAESSYLAQWEASHATPDPESPATPAAEPQANAPEAAKPESVPPLASEVVPMPTAAELAAAPKRPVRKVTPRPAEAAGEGEPAPAAKPRTRKARPAPEADA